MLVRTTSGVWMIGTEAPVEGADDVLRLRDVTMVTPEAPEAATKVEEITVAVTALACMYYAPSRKEAIEMAVAGGENTRRFHLFGE